MVYNWNSFLGDLKGFGKAVDKDLHDLGGGLKDVVMGTQAHVFHTADNVVTQGGGVVRGGQQMVVGLGAEAADVAKTGIGAVKDATLGAEDTLRIPLMIGAGVAGLYLVYMISRSNM